MREGKLVSVGQAVCADANFSLVGLVGKGSYKETYHVITEDGSSLALKVFSPGNSPERTEREIDAIRRCNHPNIGRLISIRVQTVDSLQYLTTLEEYLPGGTLGERINGKRVPLSDVLRIGKALISAVGHIASHDLVHRDIKPDNIMFRDDGLDPIIVDFGIVRDLSLSSITKSWLAAGPGTPYYAAPEQLENRKHLIDWRTDQFALGVVLTETALGYHPYSNDGDAPIDVVTRVAERGSFSDRFIRDTEELQLGVLTTMVAPWPVQRFRKADELLEAWQQQGRANG